MTDFSTQDVQQHATAIMKAIVTVMKVQPYEVCVCGSGKKLRQCCDGADGKSVIFTATAFEKVKSYRNAKGGTVENIPQGLMTNFFSNSSNRFRCLWPSCGEATVSCHLIPENALRQAFGSFCSDARLQDDIIGVPYVKTSVNQAGTLSVFCGTHDNDLFKLVDDLRDLNSKEKTFLLAFKSICFSLRKVQIGLGVDFQTELYRPFFYLEKNHLPQGANVRLTLSKHFEEQYLRFKIILDLFKACLKVYEKKDFDQFRYLFRTVSSERTMFFSGLVNPLFDLEGIRVNDPKTPVNMTITGIGQNGELRLFLAAPPKSKIPYANLFRQLKEASDTRVLSFVEDALESAHVMPIIASL